MNTPIIDPGWFYLIGVCDVLKSLSKFLLIVSALALAVTLVVWAIGIWEENWYEKDDEYKFSAKLTKIFTPLSIVFMLLCIFIPSKDTLYAMLAAKYITPANIETAADCGENVIDYIVEKIGEITEKE